MTTNNEARLDWAERQLQSIVSTCGDVSVRAWTVLNRIRNTDYTGETDAAVGRDADAAQSEADMMWARLRELMQEEGVYGVS